MSRSMLVIKVIASELLLFLLSAVVVLGGSGLAGNWLNTMCEKVAPNLGAWIETIEILIGVPIESR